MTRTVASSNVVLPPIRTLFPHSTFQSTLAGPPPSDQGMPFMPLKERPPLSQRQLDQWPQPQFPSPTPKHLQQGRRVSTVSTSSSVPPLTFSPSPSPPPPPSSSQRPPSQRVLLVPCSLNVADVVVVAEPNPQTALPKPSPTSPPAHCPARSTSTHAVLLVGDAIAHAAKDERKMHPYRILRERRRE
ncbi:hypothetical protein JB92DRAFT_3108587 [Gautieria morchelliformis]|nr:hypothetical protein JB92DRAFT_3108587 [Gautieria morchelliformis]